MKKLLLFLSILLIPLSVRSASAPTNLAAGTVINKTTLLTWDINPLDTQWFIYLNGIQTFTPTKTMVGLSGTARYAYPLTNVSMDFTTFINMKAVQSGGTSGFSVGISVSAQSPTQFISVSPMPGVVFNVAGILAVSGTTNVTLTGGVSTSITSVAPGVSITVNNTNVAGSAVPVSGTGLVNIQTKLDALSVALASLTVNQGTPGNLAWPVHDTQTANVAGNFYVGVSASALPTGGSTSALQTTINNTLLNMYAVLTWTATTYYDKLTTTGQSSYNSLTTIAGAVTGGAFNVNTHSVGITNTVNVAQTGSPWGVDARGSSVTANIIGGVAGISVTASQGSPGSLAWFMHDTQTSNVNIVSAATGLAVNVSNTVNVAQTGSPWGVDARGSSVTANITGGVAGISVTVASLPSAATAVSVIAGVSGISVTAYSLDNTGVNVYGSTSSSSGALTVSPYYIPSARSASGAISATQTTSVTSITNCAVEIDMTGLSAVNMQFTGFGTASLTPQMTLDGTNWIAVNPIQIIGGNPAAVPVNSITASGIYTINLPGTLKFRVVCSSFTSGPIVTTLRATVGRGFLNSDLIGVNVTSTDKQGDNGYALVVNSRLYNSTADGSGATWNRVRSNLLNASMPWTISPTTGISAIYGVGASSDLPISAHVDGSGNTNLAMGLYEVQGLTISASSLGTGTLATTSYGINVNAQIYGTIAGAPNRMTGFALNSNTAISGNGLETASGIFGFTGSSFAPIAGIIDTGGNTGLAIYQNSTFTANSNVMTKVGLYTGNGFSLNAKLMDGTTMAGVVGLPTSSVMNGFNSGAGAMVPISSIIEPTGNTGVAVSAANTGGLASNISQVAGSNISNTIGSTAGKIPIDIFTSIGGGVGGTTIGSSNISVNGLGLNTTSAIYAFNGTTASIIGSYPQVTDTAAIKGLMVSPMGVTNTYSASFSGTVVTPTATDIFTITGSATHTVTIYRVFVSGQATSISSLHLLFAKRSSADSSGTSTSTTAVPMDSSNRAATATLLAYTVNPTLGTLVGYIGSWTQGLPSSIESGSLPFMWPTANGMQPCTLRGTGEQLTVFAAGGIIPVGSAMDFWVEWSEF